MKTAVEWLVEQIKDYDFAPLNTKDYEIIIPIGILKSKVEQAKAMEKEQIVDAFQTGDCRLNAEQYYNETFIT